MNQYVSTKAGSTFEQQKQVLVDSIERKQAGKTTVALQYFTFYETPGDFLDLLITVLSTFNEKKLHRIAHYHLTELSSRMKSINYKIPLSFLQKEIAHKELGRRVMSLINLALITTKDETLENILVDIITTWLRDNEGEKTDKGKKLGGFFSKGTDLPRERAVTRWAALLACRLRFTPSPFLIGYVINCMRIPDPVGARHACALVKQYSESMEFANHGPSIGASSSSPASVLSAVRSTLPHLQMKESVSLVDTIARVYYTNMCADFARKGLTTNGGILGGEDFFQFLCQSLLDVSPRVQFEAILGLAKIEWTKLEKSLVLPIASNTESDSNASTTTTTTTTTTMSTITEPISVVDMILKKLKQAIESTSVPLIHSACRSCCALAENFSLHFCLVNNLLGGDIDRADDQGQHDAKHPLSSMYPLVLDLFRSSPNVSVRTQAIRCLFWMSLPDSPQLQTVIELITADMFALPDDSLPGHSLRVVFQDVHKRVQAVPSFSSASLSLVASWHRAAPEKFDIPLATSIWTTVVSYGVPGRALVLRNLFDILDTDVVSVHHEVSSTIKSEIYRFLGEHGNMMADEYSEKRVHSASSALLAILARLQSGLLVSAYEISVNCLFALTVIALRSSFGVQRTIGSFLASIISQQRDIRHEIAPVLHLLNRIAGSRDMYLQLMAGQNGTLSDQQLVDLYNEQELLMSRISLYCSTPRGFCALGPESKPFLKQHYDVFVKGK